ncbi:YggS family pyridoxal phosphate-dependent enzyme [Hyphococcus sp.]|uniref:YggS family pyridoxal phosphate-dependent enzyme n=1 Tax=Hyphococcus sp. TaxID=2038636 RepID=UPI003CCBEB27
MPDSVQNANPQKSGVDVQANLAAIKAGIEKALKEAGRPSGAVTLTAVSKQHDETRILQALDAGHRVFGENRVQEAMAKWPPLRDKFPDIELRLIGPLQTNKAKEAVALFDVIESLDRPKLARALAKEMENQGKRPALLIQVNTGEEAQKAGVIPAEADAFIAECRDGMGLPIEGLMCIPPADDDPAPHFALLEKIAARTGLQALSMGMSADYAIAAQLGASHVRVGSGVFGPRPQA